MKKHRINKLLKKNRWFSIGKKRLNWDIIKKINDIPIINWDRASKYLKKKNK